MASTDFAAHGEFARLWTLDPGISFLNHGSFGACPRAVLEHQQRLRERLEREPVTFLAREIEGLLDGARAALAGFVGAAPEDLVFVTNATSGVNAVLRSLAFRPGDELLTTNHAYNACRNALHFVAERAGARVVVAEVPFPIGGPGEAVAAILARVTPRTRLALIDHVTSPTGLVLPIAEVVAELAARGVDTLVDGAHAPGMLALDLGALGAAYYTGNCHKWLCTPKGAAFLWVRRDLQPAIRPLTISHGANSPRTDRSRFLLEFDWTGTGDPTAVLSIPEAIRYLGSLLPGGWPELRAENRAKVLAGREAIGERLGIPPPAPPEMIGSLGTLPLPGGSPVARGARDPFAIDPLQDALLERHRIEVPVFAWPSPPRRAVRISAQLYNRPEEYAALAEALATLLGEGR